MRQNLLKKRIAESAYNILFGAKLNFSTYEMSSKIPTVISYISLSVGVISLSFVDFNTKVLAVTLILLGLFSLVISKDPLSLIDYQKSGNELTRLHDELKNLYDEVTLDDSSTDIENRLNLIQIEARDSYRSNQILLSSWFAHYKLFNEHQIDWLNEELKFDFWKDKIPSSLKFIIYLMTASGGAYILYNYYLIS